MKENRFPILMYQTEDGVTNVNVTFEEDTVWLTQEQMAELFQKAKSTINEHIKNIYADGELSEATTLRKFGNSEFSTKPLNLYNLDMVISVGYRVRSQRGGAIPLVSSRYHQGVHAQGLCDGRCAPEGTGRWRLFQGAAKQRQAAVISREMRRAAAGLSVG